MRWNGVVLFFRMALCETVVTYSVLYCTGGGIGVPNLIGGTSPDQANYVDINGTLTHGPLNHKLIGHCQT
jgi:hypothetical protein